MPWKECSVVDERLRFVAQLLVDWQPVADLNRGHPLSESGALPTELTGIKMVRAGGFEPPVSCFQGRQGRPGSPTPCQDQQSEIRNQMDAHPIHLIPDL